MSDATQWHVHKIGATEGPERLRDCPQCLALNAVGENAAHELEELRGHIRGSATLRDLALLKEFVEASHERL